MHLQIYDGPIAAQPRAAIAQQEASAARAQADVAREAAAAAREQAREHVREQTHEQTHEQMEMLRRQMDAMRESRDGARPIILRQPPSGGPTPRLEKMLFGGFVIVVLAAVVILYPLVRAFARRLEGGRGQSDPLGAASAQRLERIEHAVDAMALEIERISEGQRFTTKLLSSRADAPVPLQR